MRPPSGGSREDQKKKERVAECCGSGLQTLRKLLFSEVKGVDDGAGEGRFCLPRCDRPERSAQKYHRQWRTQGKHARQTLETQCLPSHIRKIARTLTDPCDGCRPTAQYLRLQVLAAAPRCRTMRLLSSGCATRSILRCRGAWQHATTRHVCEHMFLRALVGVIMVSCGPSLSTSYLPHRKNGARRLSKPGRTALTMSALSIKTQSDHARGLIPQNMTNRVDHSRVGQNKAAP